MVDPPAPASLGLALKAWASTLSSGIGSLLPLWAVRLVQQVILHAESSCPPSHWLLRDREMGEEKIFYMLSIWEREIKKGGDHPQCYYEIRYWSVVFLEKYILISWQKTSWKGRPWGWGGAQDEITQHLQSSGFDPYHHGGWRGMTKINVFRKERKECV